MRFIFPIKQVEKHTKGRLCFIFIVLAASWFAGNLNELYKEFLSNQTVTTLDDIAFTINGEPGDLVACGGGMFYIWYLAMFRVCLMII